MKRYLIYLIILQWLAKRKTKGSIDTFELGNFNANLHTEVFDGKKTIILKVANDYSLKLWHFETIEYHCKFWPFLGSVLIM